jgi:hypothetical protein
MTSSARNDDELKDIALCYSALGLSVGDSPNKIEMTYKRIVATNKAGLASPDPQVRENANQNLRLVEEMYSKIRYSVTYQSALKDQEKKSKMRDEVEQTRIPARETVVMDKALMNCPMCHSVISKGTKSCPRCKARIETPVEKMMKVLSSPAIIIIFGCLVVLGIIAFFWIMYPDQIRELATSLSG